MKGRVVLGWSSGFSGAAATVPGDNMCVCWRGSVKRGFFTFWGGHPVPVGVGCQESGPWNRRLFSWGSIMWCVGTRLTGLRFPAPFGSPSFSTPAQLPQLTDSKEVEGLQMDLCPLPCMRLGYHWRQEPGSHWLTRPELEATVGVISSRSFAVRVKEEFKIQKGNKSCQRSHSSYCCHYRVPGTPLALRTQLNKSWFLFLRACSLTEKIGLLDVPRDVSGLKERFRLCILGA